MQPTKSKREQAVVQRVCLQQAVENIEHVRSKIRNPSHVARLDTALFLLSNINPENLAEREGW